MRISTGFLRLEDGFQHRRVEIAVSCKALELEASPPRFHQILGKDGHSGEYDIYPTDNI